MKILIITYSFLPSSKPNAKRPFYFTKAFLKEGWSVDVVTSYSEMLPQKKELLSDPKLNILRIEDPLETSYRKLNKSLKTVLFRTARAVLWPDQYVLWGFRILRKISLNKYDRVLLCLRPESLLLSFISQLSPSWIIDCQEVFYPVHIVNRRSPIPWILSPLFVKLQQKGFKKAGRVIFTSNSARQEYIRRGIVPVEKAEHIPLFYDDRICKNTPPPKEQFVIAYFGLFGTRNGIRSPQPFFQALKQFLEWNPSARSKTRFIFYGRCENDEVVVGFIKELGLEDVVKINQQIPYEAYIELLPKASVFLLLVAKQDTLFIPSKMLDYFKAKRPILGLIPLDSETASILKEANMNEYVCEEKDIMGCAKNIEKLWNKWLKGLSLCENSKTTMWSESFQTKRVLEIMRSCPPKLNPS